MRYTPDENKKKIKYALFLATNQGFDKWAIYTEAYLETGIFTSTLCDVYNYFGLMPDGKWKVSEDKLSFEYDGDGKRYNIVEGFCAFGSEYTGIAFYLMEVRRNEPIAYENRSDYRAYFNGLSKLHKVNGKMVNDGFSTSLTYSQDLINLYERLRDKGEFNDA